MISILEDNNPAEILEFSGYGSFDCRTILLVDTSSSMNESAGGVSATKLQAAKDACKAFLGVVRPQDHVGLSTFDTSVRTVFPLGTAPAAVRDGLDGIQANGKTAWRDAVNSALETFAHQPGRRNVILLTDGLDNSSSVSLEQVSQKASELNIPIHVVGLGSSTEIDEAALLQLAHATRGWPMLTPDASKLADLYRDIGKSVKDEVTVTYLSRRPVFDGTLRTVSVVVTTDGKSIGKEIKILEPHWLNISAHPGIFAFFLALIGLAYGIPVAKDRHERARLARARAEAFLPPPDPVRRPAPSTWPVNRRPSAVRSRRSLPPSRDSAAGGHCGPGTGNRFGMPAGVHRGRARPERDDERRTARCRPHRAGYPGRGAGRVGRLRPGGVQR